MVRIFGASVTIVGVAGCLMTTYGSIASFKSSDMLKRASFEMSCPEDKLVLTELGNRSLGVNGCDKKLVYVEVPNQGWVLNSATR